jgi:xanthine phosphoribosyltransferase
VVVRTDYLVADDVVLIIDDFLANGAALRGLIGLCDQAGSTVAGVAIAIEKCFTGAGDALRAQGVRLESLAAIESMSEDGIVFRS